MTLRPEGPLDLRHLPPPEPLERALREIDDLRRGDFVHLVLVHEPAPLLALLPSRRIDWRLRTVAPGEVHVLCWRAADEAARTAAAVEADALPVRT